MAKKKPRPDGSKSPQTVGMSRAMLEGYQALHEAHINYSQALAMAQDTELSSDGMLDLREKGRVYAEAVSRYASAVMAWLAHADVNKEEAVKFLRKATGE